MNCLQAQGCALLTALAEANGADAGLSELRVEGNASETIVESAGTNSLPAQPH